MSATGQPEIGAGAGVGSGAGAGTMRPRVVLVGTGLTPYRVHFLRRLLREIPEVAFHTLNTNHPSAEPWRLPIPFDLDFEHLDTRARPGRGLSEAAAQWRMGGRVIARLKALEPAAVVVNGYHRTGHLRVISWCHARGIPLMFASDSNIHADQATGLARALKRTIVRSVVRRCDPILVCGSLGTKYFERYGARAGQCVNVPYEPDYEHLRAIDPARVEQVRARLRLDPSRKRLVFCARLAEQKRPDLVVDAFAEVAGDFPNWDLVMAGDGPLREWLLYRVNTDLLRRVQFTGFIQDPLDVAALYRSCDVLALSSDWEPWGVVVNEAVAAGLAVVSTSVVGASAELVRDGVNGRLVPPGNLRLFAQGLREVMSPGVADAMKARAPEVLAAWRREADPVEGMREALRRVGVLGGVGSRVGTRAGSPVSSAPPSLTRARARAQAWQAREEARPVAFVGGGLTPYRIHLMKRLRSEVRGLHMRTALTRHPFYEPWKITAVEGFDIDFLDPQPPPRGGALHDLRGQWGTGGRLLSWLRRHRPRAVVFHSYDHLAHLRGLAWCKRMNVPAFLYVDSNIHGDDPTPSRRAVKKRLIPWLYRRTRAIFVFGSCGRKFYERYGVPGEHCVYCPMEPDYAQIDAVTEADVEAARAAHGLSAERKRFMFCARMTQVKRPDLLIDAFVAIAQQRPDWDVLMVGEGPLRQGLMARVPEALRPRVIWTGFVSDQRRISALYRASHALVLPSDYEPWALVVNEAAAAGLPIVATSVVGAAAELVKDGVNGRTIPPGDVAALQEALLEISAPGASDRLGEGSRRVLAQWRAEADPVRQMTAALRRAGVGVEVQPGEASETGD